MTLAAAHVLLVEDDDATRSSVAANLSAHGYRVAEANDVRSPRWRAGRQADRTSSCSTWASPTPTASC